MRPGPISVGRVLGIEIRLHPSWILIFLLVTVQLAVIGAPGTEAELPAVLRVALAAIVAALFFASVLGHELAHAVVARRVGVPVEEILLFVFGGAARLEREAPNPRAEMLIAAAGPLFNILVGVACLAPWLVIESDTGDLLVAIATLAFWVGASNLFLAAINILPAFPLDGGRFLRGIAWAVTGDFVRATRAASMVGRAMGWSLVGAGIVVAGFDDVLIGLWIVLIGWFLGQAAAGGYRRVAVERLVEGLSVGDVMLHDYPIITQNLTLDTVAQQTALAGGSRFYPVILEGDLAGAVDLAAIRRVPRSRWTTTRVADVMKRLEGLVTVTERDSLWDAVLRFDEAHVEGLPVVDPADSHRLVGLVTRDSVFSTLRLRSKALGADAKARS
ncbi:MAG: site-2 protease family protein [Candidatus Limnocylindrales bacterium]